MNGYVQCNWRDFDLETKQVAAAATSKFREGKEFGFGDEVMGKDGERGFSQMHISLSGKRHPTSYYRWLQFFRAVMSRPQLTVIMSISLIDWPRFGFRDKNFNDNQLPVPLTTWKLNWKTEDGRVRNIFQRKGWAVGKFKIFGTCRFFF